MPLPSGSSVPVSVRRATLAEILPLRHAVLRAGLPLSSADFPGDADENTLHVAAMCETGVIGCASWMRNAFEGEVAYQLRGMAVAPDWQSRGIGGRLIVFSDEELASTGIALRWCNARCAAIRFYERQGWIVASDEFDVPTAGPHRRMTFRSLLVS